MDLGSDEKSANAQAVIAATQLLWMCGYLTEAQSLVQLLAQNPPIDKSAAGVMGWIKLSQGDRSAARWFDIASGDQIRSTEGLVLYDEALSFAGLGNWQKAVEGLFNWPACMTSQSLR